MYNLLDGREASKTRKELLKKLIESKEHKPSLVVITVGDDEASKVYVRGKEKDCAEVGIDFKRFAFDETVTTNTLCEVINGLNRDDDVDGVIVQLPIPEHLDKGKILKSIAPEKDVDGFNSDMFTPCTPKGVMMLLKHYGIDVSGMNAVVVGRSEIVGKPMAKLLLNNDATVTVCHSKTKDLKQYTQNADLIVCAVGNRNTITADMVKDGVIIVDVGINRNEEGKLCGDVDFEGMKDKCSYISPVPNGVGLMTRVALLENTYLASKLK